MLTPIIATLINVLVFGKIAKISTDGIPLFLFYMSGNLFWTYFATCLGSGKSVFQSNSALFSQVYFPRLSVPISQNISALFKLFIQLFIFTIIVIYYYLNGYEIKPTFNVILIPLLLFQCSLIGLGTGIFISSLTIRYKDLNFVYNFILQFWMYISPVVYPLSVIPEDWHYILSFNPMVSVIESARQIIFGNSSLEFIYIINGLFSTFLMFAIGLIIFNKTEKIFLDTV